MKTMKAGRMPEVRAVGGGDKAEPRFTPVGDGVIVHLEETVVKGGCPDHLAALQEPPVDRDDAVAMLRWSLAWRLDICRLETIARKSRVDSGRIMAFLEAPARHAGECLTFAEAARLIRLTENRIEDRELADDAHDYKRIAECYIEVAGLHYGKALRLARRARSAHRAAIGVPSR